MNGSWQTRLRQIAAVVALEARRNCTGRQALGLYVVAALPMAPAIAFLTVANPRLSVEEVPTLFARIYQMSFLPFLVYFSCASIFTDLFRRDIVGKSLHYWFLAPVRREVLVVGKLLGALLTVAVVFEISTVLTYFSFYLHQGRELMVRHAFSAGSLRALAAYMLTTAVAVVSYGVLFLFLGLFFKSPGFPALFIWLWESINNFLPSFLQGFSLIYYLKGMLPIRVNDEIFALSSDPPSMWVSGVGLAVFVMVCLILAMREVRRIEVSYAAE